MNTFGIGVTLLLRTISPLQEFGKMSKIYLKQHKAENWDTNTIIAHYITVIAQVC